MCIYPKTEAHNNWQKKHYSHSQIIYLISAPNLSVKDIINFFIILSTYLSVKVLVSSNDTTAGYLNGKLVAGTGISFTENSDGSNETLTITNTGEDPTALAIALG